LVDRGYASVPTAIRRALLVDLAGAADCGRLGRHDPEGMWQPQLRRPLSGAAATIRELAMRLTASLSVAAELQGLPPLPLFDEIAWVLGPAGDESLRVPDRPVPGAGVAGVITIYGRMTLRANELRHRPQETRLVGGDLALLRASSWPSPGRRHVRAGVTIPGQTPLLLMILCASGEVKSRIGRGGCLDPPGREQSALRRSRARRG